MSDDASKDNPVNLDELDIDDILNNAIGSTGRPSVPSADEKLPSLIEDDVIDVKEFLKEVAEKEAAEKRLSEPETEMESIDTDALFDEFQADNFAEPSATEEIIESTPVVEAVTAAPIYKETEPTIPITPPTIQPSSPPQPEIKKQSFSIPLASNSNQQAGLDEIDIDAILNESIGSSGQPSVPPANEKLPSLFEEDVIDVEEFLKEMAEKEVIENSLASAEESMESIDTDALFDSIQVDEPIQEQTDLADLTQEIDDNASATETIPLELNEQTPDTETDITQEDQSNELTSPLIDTGKLLSQEAAAVEVGDTPIPTVPSALPFTATRRFSTHPKRHLSYLQKRAIFYALSILIWLVFTVYASIKMYQRYIAHKNAVQLNMSKPKPVLKPLPPKKAPAITPPSPPPPVSTTTAPSSPPSPPVPEKPHQEAVSTPQGLDQKDGIENFDPVQCNLEMDSPHIREELETCLRAAKVMK